MSNLPKNVAALGAILTFSTVALIGLLCDCPPGVLLKRGACCAAVLGVVGWICTCVALDVVAEGVRTSGPENKT